MASSFSPYKIQLMADGEDDGIWGDITNQNFLAYEQLIGGQVDISFTGSDIVLAYSNTNNLQNARAYRLNCIGVSGGPRTLSVPPPARAVLINNQLADALTVLCTGGAGAGYVVPAGRSVMLYNDGNNISEQVNYIGSLLVGYVVGATEIHAQRLYFNSDTGVLYGDGVTNVLGMSVAANAGLQVQKTTGQLWWYVNGQINFASNPNGDFSVRGSVSAPNGVLVGATGLFQLAGDVNTSSVVFDDRSPSASFQYNLATKALQYAAGGAALMGIDAAGNMTLAGKLTATGLTIPAGGIPGASLADGAVTTAKLADGSVTYPKMAAASVDSTKWVPGSLFSAVGPGGNFAYFQGSLAAGNQRWAWGSADPEGAGNAGNNFFINNYSNTGAFLATAFLIERSSSLVTINHGLNVIGPMKSMDANLWVGSDGAYRLTGDANTSNIIFNPNCFLQYVKATGVLAFTVNSASHFNINGVNGQVNCGTVNCLNINASTDANISGGLTVGNDIHGNSSIFSANWVGGVLGLLNGSGTQEQRVTTDSATYSDYVFRNLNGCYQRYSWASGLWTHNVNNVNVFQVDVNGNGTFKGNLTFSAAAVFNITGANGFWNVVLGGHTRWQHFFNGTTNYLLNVYDAAGNSQGSIWSIDLASQDITYGVNTQSIHPMSSGGGYVTGNMPILLNGGTPGIGFKNANGAAQINLGQLDPAFITNGSTRILAISKGDGVNPPPIYFDVDTATVWAFHLLTYSDRRLKFDVQPLTSGLNSLASLEPYTFNAGTSVEEAEARIGMPSAGIIAQDMLGTPFERLVFTGVDGTYSFDYAGLSAWYIAAFKEVKAELDETKATLAKVLARLDALEKV
jgi:hypothetical protein